MLIASTAAWVRSAGSRFGLPICVLMSVPIIDAAGPTNVLITVFPRCLYTAAQNHSTIIRSSRHLVVGAGDR